MNVSRLGRKGERKSQDSDRANEKWDISIVRGTDSWNCGGWQVRDLWKGWCFSWVQRQYGGVIIPSSGDLSLFSSRPSTDWKRPTHMIKVTLLKAFSFKCQSHVKNKTHSNIHWYMSRYLSTYGLVKLTNKINHCQECRSEVIIKNVLT